MSSFPKSISNSYGLNPKSLIRSLTIIPIFLFSFLAFSQNVGIGTTSPSEALEVSGNVEITNGRINFDNINGGTFAGQNAGLNQLLSSVDNTYIGKSSGLSNISGQNNTALGAYTLQNHTTGHYNTAVGIYALGGTTTSSINTAIGYQSLFQNSGTGNVGLGSNAGTNSTGSHNVFLGANSGQNNSGNRNVFLGYYAGSNAIGSDLLYIENSDSDEPLVYGEFDKNKLTINDTLLTKRFYVTEGATDGFVLKSNASGLASWVDPATLSNNNYWTLNGSDIYRNSNVGIGTNAPSEMLHVVGSARIHLGRLDIENGGHSTMIGYDAGTADNINFQTASTFIGYKSGQTNTSGHGNTAVGAFSFNLNQTGNSNVAVGRSAMYSNISGSYNVALGSGALNLNTEGSKNTAVGQDVLSASNGNENSAFGFEAGTGNSTGSGNTFLGQGSGYNNNGSNNVFIGNQSGENETGSEKLYITNTGDVTPLLYSEFDQNRLTINDTLLTESFYMTEGATNGYVLRSNAAGKASWVDPSSLNGNLWSISGNDIYQNNSGNVGIGTSSPELRLSLDNDGGILAKGTHGSGTSLTTNGAGTRMLWYPLKAAFRVGGVDDMQWSDSNIGNYSFAAGYNTMASGSYSTAMGFGNEATGSNSTAVGYNNEAFGENSFAAGYNNISNAQNSLAMGEGNSTGGYANAAIGRDNYAGGNISVAIGQDNNSTADVSIAMGEGNQATGNYSVAIGEANQATGSNSVSIGSHNNTANISGSSEYSVVLGSYNNNILYPGGNFSVAIGSYNSTSSNNSIALGNQNNFDIENGEYSVAIGYFNKAAGSYSTAMGNFASSSHEGSFAIGDNSTSTFLNTSLSNQYMARFSGGYHLYTHPDLFSGVILSAGGGAWASVSDKLKKENFLSLDAEDILLKVKEIPVTKWNYRTQDESIRHVGPMAQDFYEAFQLGGVGNDTTITTTDIDGINMIAIQALEKRTAELREGQNALELRTNEIDRLNEKVGNLESEVENQKSELALIKAYLEKDAQLNHAKAKETIDDRP